MHWRMDLPQELVNEILVRLPAKSLMRFKCIQRSWNALFRTPSFINTHHTHSHHLHRNEDLLMISHADNQGHCFLTLISDSQSESNFDLNCIFPEFETRTTLDEYLFEIILYGHCNGVFCLYVIIREFPNKLILWNPATREVKLVRPPLNIIDDSSFAIRGFGVDPNSNDLKVVYLSMDREHPPIAEIYNLTTDSWTLIRCDTVPINDIELMSDPKTYLVNGVCYWLTALRGQGILSFDFRNNQFCKIDRPRAPTESGNYFFDFVTEVNGSLAYAVNLTPDGDPVLKFELWIMEQDRWSKKYNVGPFDSDVFICASWKTGTEFLGVYVDGGLVSYNSYGQPMRRFQAPCYSAIHACDYVESIAPLSF